jgi:hypothetical protein
MNADLLRQALSDRLWIECGAPGCVTMSANARAMCGSLNIGKRSTHRSMLRNERRSRTTSTCFSNEVVIAPTPASCATSSVSADVSLLSSWSDASNCSTIGAESDANKSIEAPYIARK